MRTFLVLSLMDLHHLPPVARQIRRFASHPNEGLSSEIALAGHLQNLRYEIGKQYKLIEVRFKVQYWAEDIAFQSEVSRPYKDAICGFSGSGPSIVGAYLEETEDLIYRIRLSDKKIAPDKFFYLHFYFDFPTAEVEIVSSTK